MPRELPHNRHPAQTVGVSGVGGFQWATNPSDPAPETAPAEGRLVPLSDSNYTIRTATNKSQPACFNGINSPCRSEHCGVDRVANPANLSPCGLRECSKHPFPNSVKHPGAFVGQIVNLRRIVNPLPPRQQL